MKHRTLYFTVLFFSLVFSVSGQIEDPVDWEFSKRHVEGNQWELIFTASIDNGWSVYSQFLDDGGPVPTSINFESTDGFRTIGEAVESGDKAEGYDSIFEMEVVKYHNKLTLTQEVEVESGSHQITGYVEYMTCNETKCLPPTPVNFSFRIDNSITGSHEGGLGASANNQKKTVSGISVR